MRKYDDLSAVGVSIVIVSYNTVEYTAACIKSVYDNTHDVSFEIILSDNGSTDGTCKRIKAMFPEVIIVENEKNLGFGQANNVGKRSAIGKYIFYLNSDTCLRNNAVKYFYDYFELHEDENIGCIGAYLEDPDGLPVQSWDDYPTAYRCLLSFFHIILKPSDMYKVKNTARMIKKRDRAVTGYIIGADMFLKNDDRAVFDGRYFLYAEEADLQFCHFAKKGLECRLITGPRIIHYGGRSSPEYSADIFRNSSVRWLWLSNLKYLRKNCSRSKLPIIVIKHILLYKWRKYLPDDLLRKQIFELERV